MTINEQISKHGDGKSKWMLSSSETKIKLDHTDVFTGKCFKVGDKVLMDDKPFGIVTLIIIDPCGDPNVLVDYRMDSVTDFSFITIDEREVKLRRICNNN